MLSRWCLCFRRFFMGRTPTTTAKTTGYYVPKAAQKSIRDGVQAWQRLQKSLRKLSDMNKENILNKPETALALISSPTPRYRIFPLFGANGLLQQALAKGVYCRCFRH